MAGPQEAKERHLLRALGRESDNRFAHRLLSLDSLWAAAMGLFDHVAGEHAMSTKVRSRRRGTPALRRRP